MAISITIGGTDRTKKIDRNSFRIEQVLTRQVDRCVFTIPQYAAPFDFTPTIGQEVIVYDGTTKIFAGNIVRVNQKSSSFKIVDYDIECNDFTRQLDRVLINSSFENMTIEEIIYNVLYEFVNTGNAEYATNLKAHWKLDDDATDEIASNNLTVSGATFVTGKIAQCLEFDGSDDTASVANQTNIQNIFDSGGTVMAWIKPDSDGEGDDGRLLSKGDHASDGWSVSVMDESAGYCKLRFRCYFSGGVFTWDTVSRDIQINAWNHIAVVYDSDSVSNNPTFYVNGTSVTVTESATGSGTRDSDASYSLFVGNRSGGDATFDGKIDDVRMYSDSLTSGQVTKIAKQFTSANVTSDRLISYIAFKFEPASHVITQLADLINYDWYVDYDRDIHFFSKSENVASFDLEDSTGTFAFESLVIRKDNSQVRNVVYVRGGEYLGSTFTSEYVSNGTQNVYNLPYRYDSLKTTVTGVIWDGGVDGVDPNTVYDYMWNNQEKFVRFRGDRIPNNTSSIRISGRPYLPVLVKIRDQASIDDIASQEGGTGEYQHIIIDQSINSREGARERAAGELESYKDTISEAEFLTYQSSVQVGQKIRLNSTVHGVDEYYIINKIVITPFTESSFKYFVSLVTTKTLGVIDLLRNILLDERKKIIVNENEILDLVESNDETITITETTTTASISHNPQTESLTVTETTTTAQSLNYPTSFALGDFLFIDGGTPDTDLIARWKLNDSAANTTVTDETGTYNGVMSVNTNTVSTETLHGKGFRLTASEYFTVASLNPSSLSAFSVTFWVKFNAFVTNDRIVDQGESGPQNGFTFAEIAGPQVQFAIRNGASVVATINSGTLTTGVWYHMAGVYANNDVRYYVDAVLKGTDTSATIGSSATTLTIGKRSAGSNQMNGWLDDVRIYDKALTDAEVLEIFATSKRPFVLDGSHLG